MESQPQTSEFRNNPENIHPCLKLYSGDVAHNIVA